MSNDIMIQESNFHGLRVVKFVAANNKMELIGAINHLELADDVAAAVTQFAGSPYYDEEGTPTRFVDAFYPCPADIADRAQFAD
jgi:hypothetical protein